MYNEKHSDSTVGFTSFYQYFKDNFNLRIGYPQVDCYCECERLTNKMKNSHISEAAKRNIMRLIWWSIKDIKARKFYSKFKLETEDNKNDEI